VPKKRQLDGQDGRRGTDFGLGLSIRYHSGVIGVIGVIGAVGTFSVEGPML
jgi:hypothetical protein